MEVSGKQTRGSDTGKVCDTCQERRSVTRAAHGYCIECRDYLCEDCYHGHRDPQPSRNHRLLEGDQTPKERLPPIDMCEIHKDEKINYYCKEHSSLACQKCAFLKHRACKDVYDISELSTNSKNVQIFQEMKKKIQDLESRTVQNRQTRIQNLSKIDSNKKQAKADIKQFCAAMHARLDKLERKVDEKVHQLDKVNHKYMDKVQQECDTVTSDLKIMTAMLETSQDPCQKVLSFIAIEKAKGITENLDKRLTSLCRYNNIREYTFKPNDHLKGLITDAENLGELILNNMTGGLSLHNLQVTFKPAWNMDTVIAEKEGVINVRTQKDKSTCRITGSTMMEGNTTQAVTDKQNNSVKLADVEQKKVIFQLRLSDEPWDITLVQRDELAVTLPAAHKIQFLSVTTGSALSLGRQMNVSGECRGIAYNNDRLFLSFTDPGQVHILSMSGSVLSTVNPQADGHTQFTYPFYVTWSVDRSLLYVSDCNSHTVYCLDMNGAVKATYKDQRLKGPYAVCTAEDGSVIVCGRYSNNVFVISSDCSQGRILIDMSRGVKSPNSVSYSSDLSTMFIGMTNTDTIQVLNMK